MLSIGGLREHLRAIAVDAALQYQIGVAPHHVDGIELNRLPRANLRADAIRAAALL